MNVRSLPCGTLSGFGENEHNVPGVRRLHGDPRLRCATPLGSIAIFHADMHAGADARVNGNCLRFNPVRVALQHGIRGTLIRRSSHAFAILVHFTVAMAPKRGALLSHIRNDNA